MTAGSPDDFRSRIDSRIESTVHQAGWAVALRGLLAIIFGVIALRSPGVAASAFVIVFAVYAFADGVMDLYLASQLGRAGQRWGWYVFEGLASIALGVIALAYPHITLLIAVLLIGIRAITVGVFELIGAFSWEGLDSRWLLGLTGALSIVLGVLLLGSPAMGGLALLWTIGIYAIVFGIMMFAFGLRILATERREARLHRPVPTAG
jgi:uncharacterized membrane protein HdeD (DUF308 family)